MPEPLSRRLSNEDFTSAEADDEGPKEIVEGLIREGQLGICAGVFGVGKSPMVTDLGVHVASGADWCGRSVLRRPVVAIDFESPASVYHRNIRRIAHRAGLEVPCEKDLEPYLQHAGSVPDFSNTHAAVRFLRRVLLSKPNALVIIDPIELLFKFDKVSSVQVLKAYSGLRQLLLLFPRAALLVTFNLRKRDRRAEPPSLLAAPRDWLEEIAGSIDLLNRSDVRLGFAFHPDDPDIRVLNGIRRGEDMHPILLRQAGTPPEFSGFELVRPNEWELEQAFTSRQCKHWGELPDHFRFDEIADKSVPRSSLFRLIQRAKSLGLLETDPSGLYRKRSAQ